MTNSSSRAFTIFDLLVCAVTVVLLGALALPAISAARRFDRTGGSADNLRALGAAHALYAMDWNGRQLTFIVDDASTFGDFSNWYINYAQQHGSDGSWGDPGNHPPVILGWGRLRSGRLVQFRYETVQRANASLDLPINIGTTGTSTEFYGAFRCPNAAQFTQYLGGRFYDEVFYAPADGRVIDAIGEGFAAPCEFWIFADVDSSVGDIPAWSSYCLSPAAMFSPAVMAHDDPDDERFNGSQDPFSLPDGFASPGYFQARYPDLKTHVLEHHWLQEPPGDCNDLFDFGTYGGCEPYYFNQGIDSIPQVLFYDGHVAGLPVAEAVAADAQVRQQMNLNWGLWSQDTPWGIDGYRSEYAIDGTRTSFHILSTDGILGRDTIASVRDPDRRSRSRAAPSAAPRPRHRRHAPPSTRPPVRTSLGFD